MIRPPLLLFLLLALALPGGAEAQDGVFVDPDSPSGKEYQIPLESARRQANPAAGTGKVAPGRRESPLFGEGIEPEDAQTPAGAAGRDGDDPGDATATAPGTPAPEVVRAIDAARSGSGDSGGALPVLAAAAVLLLAVAGTLLARRREGGAASRP